jgi:hypothetical protein
MDRSPNLIQSKSSWHDYLQKALQQTEELQQLDRGWALLKQVRAQLEFMQSCTADGRSPTAEEAKRIDVGPLAVRNFEDSQPDYANWLMGLDYGFSRWDSLP